MLTPAGLPLPSQQPSAVAAENPVKSADVTESEAAASGVSASDQPAVRERPQSARPKGLLTEASPEQIEWQD